VRRYRTGMLGLLAAAALAIACGDTVSGGADAGDPGTPDASTSPTADGASGAPDGAPGDGGDPAAPGVFAAHVANNVSIPAGNATITATICSPSTDGGATAAAGPYPLLVVSPGFQIDRSQYRSMCDHFASWGYVVVLQTYSQSGFSIDHMVLAQDIGRIIDWATGAGSGLSDRVDGSRVGAAGHSLGGKVSILAAVLDDRIGAVVGWDPVDANAPSVTPEMMGDLTIPLAVLGETLDSTGGFMPCAPAEDNYQQYFKHACAASDALEVTVEGADHMSWLDDRGSCGIVCSFCANGPTPDAYTREVTRRVSTSWFEKHLRGSTATAPYLELPLMGSGLVVRTDPC
jgi:dienelactone hydrolase